LAGCASGEQAVAAVCPELLQAVTRQLSYIFFDELRGVVRFIWKATLGVDIYTRNHGNSASYQPVR
jgi:hypothetical protein